MTIRGKVFDVYEAKFGTQLVLQKQIFGKMTPIAFTVWGKAREFARTLKKKDKIKGTVSLVSKFINGRYLTDVSMYDIEKIESIRPKKPEWLKNKGGFLFENE